MGVERLDLKQIYSPSLLAALPLLAHTIQMRFLALIAAIALAAPLVFADSNARGGEEAEIDMSGQLDFDFEVTEEDSERYHRGSGHEHKKPPTRECRGLCQRPRRLETMHGDTEYFVFDCKRNIKNSEARHACRKMGGRLADVSSEHVFHYLAGSIDRHAYVNSWESNNYNHACLALYPPNMRGHIGALVVPPGGCEGASSFICEVEVGKCPYLKKDRYESGMDSDDAVYAAGCLNL